MSEAVRSEQEALIVRRRAGFDSFVGERYPVLEDFFSILGVTAPSSVRVAAHALLEPFDTWLSGLAISEPDRHWLTARLAYFIGEVFAQKYGGEWLLCEDPARRSFGRYVVGRFRHAPDKGFLVDAFEAANALASAPAPRSLSAVIAEIDRDLSSLQH